MAVETAQLENLASGADATGGGSVSAREAGEPMAVVSGFVKKEGGGDLLSADGTRRRGLVLAPSADMDGVGHEDGELFSWMLATDAEVFVVKKGVLVYDRST